MWVKSGKKSGSKKWYKLGKVAKSGQIGKKLWLKW